jgi:quercetin dioxygenase-like cupin family protein
MTTETHVWRFGPDGKAVSFLHVFDYSIHEQAASARSAKYSGQTLQVLGDTVHVKSAGGQFEVFDVSGPRDSGPPPHAHPWDEVYIGLTGEIEVMVGDSSTKVGPGDIVRAAGGTLHCYRFATDDASFRVITAGHRASAFFADMHANVAMDAPMPEVLPRVFEVAQRNGLSSPLFV